MSRIPRTKVLSVHRVELEVRAASSVKSRVDQEIHLPDLPRDVLYGREFVAYLKTHLEFMIQVLATVKDAEKQLTKGGMREPTGLQLGADQRISLNFYDIDKVVLGRVLGTLDVYVLGERQRIDPGLLS
jgi:hypothetical protein